MFTDLREGVVEIFLDAQAPVFEFARKSRLDAMARQTIYARERARRDAKGNRARSKEWRSKNPERAHEHRVKANAKRWRILKANGGIALKLAMEKQREYARKHWKLRGSEKRKARRAAQKEAKKLAARLAEWAKNEQTRLDQWAVPTPTIGD